MFYGSTKLLLWSHHFKAVMHPSINNKVNINITTPIATQGVEGLKVNTHGVGRKREGGVKTQGVRGVNTKLLPRG